MPELRWDETDFLECLGVIPETDEDQTCFSYTVVRQGLVLSVSVLIYDSVIELRLKREGSAKDLLAFSLLVTGRIEYKREKWGDYLLFPVCRLVADPYYYMHEGGAGSASHEAILEVELAVDPDIRIQFV